MERKYPVLETENPVSLPALENAASPLVILVGEEDELSSQRTLSLR
jgi:hypothetical protein